MIVWHFACSSTLVLTHNGKYLPLGSVWRSVSSVISMIIFNSWRENLFVVCSSFVSCDSDSSTSSGWSPGLLDMANYCVCLCSIDESYSFKCSSLTVPLSLYLSFSQFSAILFWGFSVASYDLYCSNTYENIWLHTNCIYGIGTYHAYI